MEIIMVIMGLFALFQLVLLVQAIVQDIATKNFKP